MHWMGRERLPTGKSSIQKVLFIMSKTFPAVSPLPKGAPRFILAA